MIDRAGWTSTLDGVKQGVLLGLAVLALVLPPLGNAPRPPPPAAAPQLVRSLDLRGEAATPPVSAVARWVVASGDNGARAFVIIDKSDARVYVFDRAGTLQGATPVLLGYATGDHTVAGIGQRPIADVQPQERTTPAGRFVAEPGRNTLGEDVVWVDYDAAVSMHRVRVTDPRERRLERLATPTADDNRISYGCINVPVAFFEGVIWPAFRAGRGVVYVLPEVKPLADVFPAAVAHL